MCDTHTESLVGVLLYLTGDMEIVGSWTCQEYGTDERCTLVEISQVKDVIGG